ncbi:MAG: 16S rRNA (guanine(527)-N(7))-methyltransferase RsmG [Saprospiraceae bacterium]|nr:16S rRNA (guanine(527)-N(7))-methyltransferase RsmG [Saprospiraceae bacterium]
MEIILKYFPNLTENQLNQFAQLDALYRDWNAKINVVSRKDIDQLYEHHVLHSLSIGKVVQFKSGATILDIGTGGGFPGIPLAIMFPETKFTLLDGTRKKITVVQEVANGIGLKNVIALHQRAEEFKQQKFDFAVSRAVAPLEKLVEWSFRLIKQKDQQHILPNGLIALKGGDIDTEIKALPKGSYTEVYPLSDFFEEEYYQEKYAVYIQA